MSHRTFSSTVHKFNANNIRQPNHIDKLELFHILQNESLYNVNETNDNIKCGNDEARKIE